MDHLMVATEAARQGETVVIAAAPEERGDLVNMLSRGPEVQRVQFAAMWQEIHYLGGGRLILVPLRGGAWHHLSMLDTVSDVWLVVDDVSLEQVEQFAPVVAASGGRVRQLTI